MGEKRADQFESVNPFAREPSQGFLEVAGGKSLAYMFLFNGCAGISGRPKTTLDPTESCMVPLSLSLSLSLSSRPLPLELSPNPSLPWVGRGAKGTRISLELSPAPKWNLVFGRPLILKRHF